MSALGHKRTFAVQNAMSALPPKADIPQRGVSPGHAGLICPGLESGGAAQENCVMLLRPQFNHYCEVVGRASAFVAFVTMASLILAATAVDVLR